MRSILRSRLRIRTTGMWLVSANALTDRRNPGPISSMIASEGIG